jgi:hypothetical protein
VRQPLRARDLRATFVTIALALGKTEAWISDRTEHHSHEMVAAYARKARPWNLGLGPLGDLIPELAGTEPSARIAPRLPPTLTIPASSNGRTADFGSAYWGSNPYAGTSAPLVF